MKKKRVLSFVVVFLIVVYLFGGVLAASSLDGVESQFDEGREKLEGVKGGIDTLTEKEQREEYLKEEWTKILGKTSFGSFIVSVGEFLEKLNPVFKLLIGIEFSLSWIFFLSLIMWIAIIVIVYKPLKEVGQFDGGLSFLISLGVAILAAQGGAIQLGLNLYLLPIFEDPWMLGLAALITVIIMISYWIYLKKTGKTLRDMLKKAREEKREERARIKDQLEENELRAKGFKP